MTVPSFVDFAPMADSADFNGRGSFDKNQAAIADPQPGTGLPLQTLYVHFCCFQGPRLRARMEIELLASRRRSFRHSKAVHRAAPQFSTRKSRSVPSGISVTIAITLA